MAATVTERTRDRRFGRDRNGKRTARRGFDVTGVDDEREAEEAVPQKNDLHPLSAGRPLRVLTHSTTTVSPGLFRVRVMYAEPESSERHEEDWDDPLLRAPRLLYVDQNREVEIDTDDDGNPLVNSARQTFRDRASAYITEFNLQVKVNEPFFDHDLAADLRLSVNETALIIQGVELAAPLEARLMKMRPDGEFSLDDDYVRVLYEWNIKRHAHPDDAPDDVSPHAIRIKDQGMQAAAEDGSGFKLIQIYDADKEPEPVTDDVALDGSGAPLQGGYRIGKEDEDPASLDPPKGTTGSDGRVAVEEQDEARFLWYNPPRLTVRDHVGQLGF